MATRQAIVPEDVRIGMARAGRRLSGWALIAFSIYLSASLFSYSPNDDAFSVSSTFATSNLGGAFGSAFWSFMLQFFGGASPIIICEAVVFGRYLINRESLNREPKAIIMWALVAVPPLCLVLSYFFAMAGGLLGQIMKSRLDSGAWHSHVLAFSASLALALLALYHALDLTRESIARFGWRIIGLHAKLSRRGTAERGRPQKKTEPKPVPKPEPARVAARKSSTYRLPPLDLLSNPKPDRAQANAEANEKKARMLENILSEFGVSGKIASIKTGPVITLFEMEPGKGIKTSRIAALSDEIARDMSALSARVAVVPGTNKIGIELPNTHRKTVYLKEQLSSRGFMETGMALPVSLGADTGGRAVFADLARMPHLLIAGRTGSGKSVGVNAMILSLLYRFRPDEVKLIMIDPKMTEFPVYNDIPHLLIPVVTDPVKAVAALKWAVREMEERNRNLSALGAKNIESYNAKAAHMEGKYITREVQTGFSPETGEPLLEEKKIEIRPMPYIVVIVDEMHDLMLVAGKEVEAAIARLAAMARAAGIHLILATQRPSVDVITGTIKANFPNRIAYQVAQEIDSRTIIGRSGAEKMTGKGDMLYMASGDNLIRIHGAYVGEDEIERVAAFIKAQDKPAYVRHITASNPGPRSAMSLLDRMAARGGEDDLYSQAVQIILSSDRPSISYLQRQLGIGYNKSANLIERMEKAGILSAPDSTGKRVALKKNEKRAPTRFSL